MESMHQCEKCGGWVKSITPSTCTCPKILIVDDTSVLTSEQIKELTAPYSASPEQQAKLDRQDEIQRDFGPGAVQVAPYKPNRKQRRSQEAVKRKVAKNYPLRHKEYKRDE